MDVRVLVTLVLEAQTSGHPGVFQDDPASDLKRLCHSRS